MYGVVDIKGHQYRVEAGDIIDVQKVEANAGETVEFKDVFFIGGENPQVGFPLIEKAVVKAKVLRHDRARKQIIFRRGVGKWQKKNGHRQHFTSLEITEITDGQGKSVKAKAKAKKAAPKAAVEKTEEKTQEQKED